MNGIGKSATARRPLNGNIRESSNNSLAALPDNNSNDDNACVVCFKNVEIYSIGDCDHPVCYECSTRMRVLCQQNECPICRHVLSKVLFTFDKSPYRELEASNRSDFYSKKYRIGFCSADIQQKFFQLLDHPCPKCEVPPYRTFQALRNHVRREHNLFYCDLCVENLKIFTFERRCYTQAELHQHNTKGDPDNRSHRGHPLCEYCNQRYVDRDELFRHLRREHYFCHFCDADGCNEFYNDYADLAEHFRQEHFLCEEGKCATEQFIGAFRNEIEYKAHVASVHGKSLNKQQAKQTRTLQLEITLGPRGRSGQTEQGIASMRSRNDEQADFMEEFPSSSTHRSSQPVTINEEEFPLLGGTALGPNVSLVRPPPPSMRNLSGTSGLARTKENFPALGGGGGGGGNSISNKPSNQPPVSAVLKKQPPPTSANNRGGSKASNGMVLHVSNRPAPNGVKKSTEADFPALSGGGKGKKGARNLEEDMAPNNSGIPMSNVSAKHRTLVDDYVSVANPSTYQKIQMVQKEELEAKARMEALKKNAPKLTTADFPSLGPSSKARDVNVKPPTLTNWTKPVSERKQRELDNRKAKVAPAPVLPTPNTSSSSKAVSKAKNPEQSVKKDKTSTNKENKINNNEQKPSKSNSSTTAIRAPPGFNCDRQLKPPPGFISNVTVNSVAKLPNALTFTSSLGESFNIVPSAHNYTDPPEATTRNQKLVDEFREILKTPEALDEFRLLSQKFRDGSCNGQAYYDHCKGALQSKFNKIFPELLAMLPDISKQQELYVVHKQHVNSLTPAQRKLIPNLEVCHACSQILLEADHPKHQKDHELVQNYPILGANVNSLVSSNKHPK